MKIAISATGTTLDAEVDPRFGRCQYFIIVDPETMQFEALENSGAIAWWWSRNLHCPDDCR